MDFHPQSELGWRKCERALKALMKPITVRVARDLSRATASWEVYYYSNGTKVRVARCQTRPEAENVAAGIQENINAAGATSKPDVPLTDAQIAEYREAKEALGSVRLITAVHHYLETVPKTDVFENR